jgi:multidrug resistance efflux pump
MEEELKLIERQKNDVISRTEKWIFSWGIILTSIVLCILMLMAFILPYKNSMSFNAQFHTQHKIVPVISPYNGIIKRDVFDTSNVIEPNAFLFTIFDLSGQKETSVYAKESGYYMPNKINFRSKTYVSKNDTLFYIMPDIKNKDEVYCTAVADEFDISKLSIGDKVLINLEGYREDSGVSGTISSIAKIPDQSGKYPFQISLEYKDIRYLSEKGMFYFDQQGKAKVKFQPQKLAYKLLNFL